VLKDAVKPVVKAGYVTLSGEVDWPHQRAAAVGAVRNIIGPRGMNDEITVKRHIHPGDIKARIQSALQRQARLDASAMSIAVDGTTVTLGGVVDSWSERMAARDAAWSEPGVQNVIDNLSVAD